MKKLFIIISIIALQHIPLKAVSDSLYNEGNRLYQQGLYEESIDKYKSLVDSGYESANLYYNLGNAYFRSNKLGKARLYYEKALKIFPADEDALANNTYLKSLLADRFEEVPMVFYKKWFKSLILSYSSNQWAYLSVFTFLMSVISALVYFFFRRAPVRKAGFYSAAVLLFISVLSFGASWKQYRLIRYPDSAIVIDLSVNVNSSPRETGTGLFILHEGAKVWLEDKAGNWQEIRLSDGRKGWVPEESIEVI
ncbi:MAG: tetratricopeptide repeat protein [Bacteroidales bacterium]|nr:tetratricopeptide repeat protein [Bacteroidales bacterium]MCP5515588.1 tetratricopeptide repeat protein [Spirochaetales bacterium]